MTEGQNANGAGPTPDVAQASVAAQTRARLRASLWATAAVAVLAAVSVQSPVLGSMLVGLIPVPYALLALRYGYRPLVSLTIGLVAAGVITASTESIGAGFVVGGGLAVLAGGLAAVLAETALGRRFQAYPFGAVAAGFALLAAVGFGGWLAIDGANGVTRGAVTAVDDLYDNARRGCTTKPRSALASKQVCSDLKDQHDQVRSFIKPHAVPLVAGLAMALALQCALIAVWAFRRMARRWQMPVRAAEPFRDFAAHWTSAYVLTLGLVALMAATRASGAFSDYLMAGGTALATLGGLVIATGGVAVVRWRLHGARMPGWGQILFAAIAVLVLLPMTVVFVFILGIVDMVVHLRRDRSTIDPSQRS